ncbi:MAG: exo-alpha-sialidase [Candidatus Brocadiia bacterium]
MNSNSWHVQPLAQEHVTVYESPDPQSISAYSPGLALSQNRRLIATTDLGGDGVPDLNGQHYRRGNRGWQGRIYTSDDGGDSWTFRTTYPFLHARPFVAGDTLYVLGQADDLMIIRSDDGGETWGAPVALTDGEKWHQAPCNVHYANGCIYLVMEHRMSADIKTWAVGEFAPVLMRGRLEDDLIRRENWTFASELPFRDVMPNVEDEPNIDFFGVPFFSCPYPRGSMQAEGRNCAPIGWLETNVVQFIDTNHYWCDPDGKTYHLWMRAHTGGTGYACVAKVVEQGEEPGTGEMRTMLERVPSGRKALYVPCPGGQMKFHILFDEPTDLFWLLSTQATDSMHRAERLPDDRYNLPNNQRRRLQLHFSKNCIDWCFAGLVAVGPVEYGSRHYASMLIDGDDLHVLSRSGDERAKNAHDGNLITFHTIPNFRRLVY